MSHLVRSFGMHDAGRVLLTLFCVENNWLPENQVVSGKKTKFKQLKPAFFLI